MAFQFRLQKLLDYREEQKNKAREELAKLQRELDMAQEELAQLHREEVRLVEMKKSTHTNKLDIFVLSSIESYRSMLQNRCLEKEKAIEELSSEVEKQRQEVVEAWRNCQVLYKLKEKAYHEFLEENKAQEQRLNDELSLYGYVRNGESGNFGDESDA